MIKKIDKTLLEIATSLSHWFQRWTGKTNFFLAKIAVMLSFLSLVVEIVNYFRPLLEAKASPLQLVLSFLMTLIAAYRMTWLSKEEERVFDPSKPSLLWITMVGGDSPRWRILWILLSLLTFLGLSSRLGSTAHPILEIISSSFSTDMAAFYYLAAVTPLPPDTVRKLFPGRAEPSTIGA